MPPRPRRSAAQRASAAITDIADRDIAMSSRSRRLVESSRSGGTGRAPSADSNLSSSVRASGTGRKRQSGGISAAASRREDSSDVVPPSRRPTRGPKKRYVESESSEEEDDDDEDAEEEDDDDDDEEEQQDEIKVGDSDMDLDGLGDDDAEGEADDMELDADGEPEDLGEEDAEGDIDMEVAAPASSTPAIKVSKAAGATNGATRGRGRPSAAAKTRGRAVAKRRGGQKRARLDDDDEEDEEDDSIAGEINASVEVAGDDEDAEGDDDDIEIEEDDEEDEEDAEGETEMNMTMQTAGGEEDAEGEEEEIEVADEDDEDDDDEEGGVGGSDEDGSRAGTPDLSKMTRRQRARFEETPQEYMKLSDEVQVKKVFTAEELSMRRAEMARRRRNLSEKRNEEVKNETINKLLKRQAPKTTKKNAMGDDDVDDDGQPRPDPVMIRWISNKQGSRIVVPVEIMESPIGIALQSS